MPQKANREYRSMVLRAIADDEEERRAVSGYASTFDELYTLYEDDDIIYLEKVDRSAFDATDMDDVIMQYNHEGRVFARTSNGTLQVNADDRGLFIEADLGGTEIGRELYDEIRGGYTNKMSFGFLVSDDVEDRTELDDGRLEIIRTITGISKVFDVSAVSIPANNGTSIGVATRSKIDGVIEEVRAERLEAEKIELERLRNQVKAKAMLGGNK